ncbi:polysaccharide deacetylase family protein [Bremerella sp. JC817]|uniref:polysaccharide deacetylase family protein n=1 Tax=Bremerella sp. JC817 TaxID=3231756 RepID=UPI003458A4C9
MKWLSYRKLAKQAERLGINRLVRMIGSWRGLLVLTYHRIGNADACSFDRGVFSADEPLFRQQMEFVRDHFEVVTIDDVIEKPSHYWQNRQAVLITFDDGYVDNYEIAFPILKQLGIPALFFVATDFIDRQTIAWWDEIAWMMRQIPTDETADELDDKICEVVERYYGLIGSEAEDYLEQLGRDLGCGRFEGKSPLWMNWDMLREMAANGMRFGGHTVTHPILTRIDESRWDHELSEGKRRLEAETGTAVEAFSYPVGNPDCLSVQLMERTAGQFQVAFSCYGGVNHASRDSRWNRLNLQRWPIYGPMRQFRITVTWPQLQN